MRRSFIGVLFVLGCMSGVASVGCSTVPAKVADNVALLVSNVHALNASHKRALDAPAAITSEQADHDRSLAAATDALADGIGTWVSTHKGGN